MSKNFLRDEFKTINDFSPTIKSICASIKMSGKEILFFVLHKINKLINHFRQSVSMNTSLLIKICPQCSLFCINELTLTLPFKAKL